MVNSKIKMYVEELDFFCKPAIFMVYAKCQNYHAFIRNISVIPNALLYIQLNMFRYTYLFLLMLYAANNTEKGHNSIKIENVHYKVMGIKRVK
jgi:hypothetical protein